MRPRSTYAAASALLAIAAASPASAQKVPPAKAFGALEAVSGAALSPDGTKFSFVAPAGPGNALYISPVDGSTPPARLLVAAGDPERLDWCEWVGNTRLVCEVGAVASVSGYVVGGTRLIAIEENGQGLQVISKRDATRAVYGSTAGGDIIDWLPDEEDAVLMMQWNVPTETVGSLIPASREGYSVERVDTRTGRRRRVTQPSVEIGEYITDGLGNIRVMGVSRFTGDYVQTGEILYKFRAPDSKDWQDLSRWNTLTSEGFNPYAVDANLNVVYGFQKNNGRLALFVRQLEGSAPEKLLVEHPEVDVDRLVYLGRKRRVIGASYATDAREMVYFDEELARLRTALSRALPGAPLIGFTGASDDERKLLLEASSDTDPGTLYLLDRATNQLRPLLLVRPELQGYKLASVKNVHVKAADGTLIPAYLTLPPGSDSKNLPALVMPHGGPEYRDEWGFDWLAQFFAQRGFAVLQPNFRGSFGYGEAWFMKNGYQSWRTAIGDVADSGRWLVGEGIADPSKLAIFGWSYGGYAALQSGVIAPDLFKAVVAVAPVTDLATHRDRAIGSSRQRLARERIGTGPHVTEGSPYRNAQAIQAPVMLFHGEVDQNVDIEQSRMMADALRDAGKRVELHIYPKLQHSLIDAAAREDMLSKSDAFLRATLGIR